MTKKDYILLAGALHRALRHVKLSPVEGSNSEHEIFGINCATDHISIALAQDNPRFDREHFLAVVRGEKELHSRPSRNGRQS